MLGQWQHNMAMGVIDLLIAETGIQFEGQELT